MVKKRMRSGFVTDGKGNRPVAVVPRVTGEASDLSRGSVTPRRIFPGGFVGAVKEPVNSLAAALVKRIPQLGSARRLTHLPSLSAVRTVKPSRLTLPKREVLKEDSVRTNNRPRSVHRLENGGPFYGTESVPPHEPGRKPTMTRHPPRRSEGNYLQLTTILRFARLLRISLRRHRAVIAGDRLSRSSRIACGLVHVPTDFPYRWRRLGVPSMLPAREQVPRTQDSR